MENAQVSSVRENPVTTADGKLYVATAGRFDQIFQTFETTFPDIAQFTDKNQLVFCFTYDSFLNTGLYEIFKAQETPGPGLTKVQFGHDFMYEKKVWFFYEGAGTLEAGVSYLAEYRPNTYVNKATPLVSKSIPEILPNCWFG